MNEELGYWIVEIVSGCVCSVRNYSGSRDALQNGLLTVQDGDRTIVFNLNNPEVRHAIWGTNLDTLWRAI